MKREEYDHTELTGMDASLETSLKEYGFAWIETEDEFLFYYGIKTDSNEEYSKFDFCSMDKNLDFRKEFYWVTGIDICSHTGVNEEDFHNSPFFHKISDLLSYYGYENIFGSSYWEGLTYEEIVKEV